MTYAVTRTNILTTRGQVYSVWALSDPTINDHSTITTINGRCRGRVGTERLPAEIDVLPAMSEERSRAYRAWRQETYSLAYRLIREAFLGPDGIDGAYGFDMGECRWESDQTGSEIRYVEA